MIYAKREAEQRERIMEALRAFLNKAEADPREWTRLAQLAEPDSGAAELPIEDVFAAALLGEKLEDPDSCVDVGDELWTSLAAHAGRLAQADSRGRAWGVRDVAYYVLGAASRLAIDHGVAALVKRVPALAGAPCAQLEGGPTLRLGRDWDLVSNLADAVNRRRPGYDEYAAASEDNWNEWAVALTILRCRPLVDATVRAELARLGRVEKRSRAAA